MRVRTGLISPADHGEFGTIDSQSQGGSASVLALAPPFRAKSSGGHVRWGSPRALLTVDTQNDPRLRA